MRSKTWVLGAVLMAFCLSLGFGCGGGGGEGMEDVLPPDFDNKADTASSKVVVKGAIAFGEEKSAAFDTSKYHGYTFVGAKDAPIGLTLIGDKAQKTDTVVLLYGPKAGANWVGKPIAQDDNSAGNKFSMLSGFNLPANGEYLIIATCRNTSYRNKTYSLTLTCESDNCESEEEPPDVWTPKLRPISLQQAKNLTVAAYQVKFVVEDRPQLTWGVPWAWIEENCNRRASMVNFAFSQGETPSILPSPIPAQMLSGIVNSSAFDSATIYLAGPLFHRQQYVLHDGTVLDWSNPGTWDHHVAAVANVDGTLMVLDPSLAREPHALQDWIDHYIAAGVECPLVDRPTFDETKFYYTTRDQFPGFEKPKYLCNYMFGPPFSVNQGESVTTDEVNEELEGARSLLGANFAALKGVLVEHAQRNFTDEEISLVTSNLKPMSEAEYCTAVDFGRNWCAGYKP